MRIPLSWLSELVDWPLPAEELAHRLTMAGLEVGTVERIGGTWDGCSVGRVVAVDPHPNADRLTLCTVDTGDEHVRVVCGAPNVAAGQKVAFARAGARLYDARSGELSTLKAATIRGVRSEGMVCSERELGLGPDHEGILVLPDDAPVGAPLEQLLGDTVLDIDVTANRPDALSLLGVAYEVAAIAGTAVREPALDYPEEGPPIDEQVAVEVWDADLCPRYTATLVTGLTVGPSPQWMQDRLLRAGMRPINNVVDVTNYLMLELGQPLHAFDYHRVKERKVIVRQAKLGESLLGLDGVQRRLGPPMLVIADAQDAVGLAGVMGGAHSEVTESTTAVFLESASFHPFNTRRTAGALRLRTEAALRFEKGLRPELPMVALRRATRLILEVAGGAAAQGIIDVYPVRREAAPVTLTAARLRQVLGVDVPAGEAARVLSGLGFRAAPSADDALEVAVPYWRADVGIEDDLVEEVARVVGYDRIPTTTMSAPIPPHNPNPLRELKERVRDLFVAAGFQEIVTYSLVGAGALKVKAPGPDPLRVANPLTPEHEYLRTSLRSSLLATMASNRRLEEGPLRLFEVSRVYHYWGEGLPDEREMAVGVMTGATAPVTWRGEPRPLDFFDARGAMDAVLGRLGVQGDYQPLDDPALRPGSAAALSVAGKEVGLLGEVDAETLARFDVDGGPVVLFELDLEALLDALPSEGRRFRPVPRYPDATRDLALVVPLETSAAQVQTVLEHHPLVARVTLFDVYVGPQVAAGRRSLAYRLTLRSPERTLTTAEVERATEELLTTLQREVGATPR